MKISFRKIQKAPLKFSLDFEDNINSEFDRLNLAGVLKRLDSKIIKLEAHLKGALSVICARSAEVFFINLDEPLVLLISDGLWNVQSQSRLNSLDVVEFFDGEIDLDYILNSEVQSIRSDYHIKGE